MTLFAYLSIAVVVMHSDALSCVAAGQPFKWFSSALLSLLWPVSVPLVILGVVVHYGRGKQ